MPKRNRVKVFGSNEAGIHGAGAALDAYEKHGARWGQSYGHVGNSFGIPTKNEILEPLELSQINDYIRGFIAYARGHRKLEFEITQIGCGLAGFKPGQIAPMFQDAPDNCEFDSAWEPWLGSTYKYWGTY